MGREIKRIYIHCSVSTWGNENAINAWHKARGFGRLINGYYLSTGYHLVILNGVPFSDKIYYPYLDGSIETARSYDTQGAGVKGDNKETLHFCMIGRPGEFTKSQIKILYEVLAHHVREGLPIVSILGHYEYWTNQGKPPAKTCPGIDMDKFRAGLEKYIKTGRMTEPKDAELRVVKSNLHKALDAITSMLGGTVGY